MGARLSFLRRSYQEAASQGGDVFFDINGKNVGRLASVDCFVDLPAGTYNIRMYKSHAYGSMVGFADATVTLGEGDDVMVRYSPPVTVNQPGHIILSDYTKEAADAIASESDRQMYAKMTQERAAAERASGTTKKIIIWVAVGIGATITLAILAEVLFLSSLF